MTIFTSSEIQLAMRHFIAPGDTVYDVGAHFGWLTVPLSRLVGTRGQVVAFEASSVNFQQLTQTIEDHRIQNTQRVNAAVYHTSHQELDFHHNAISFASSLYANHAFDINAIGSEIIKVRTLALDDYMSFSGTCPSFVKVDVESAEIDVLKGARQLIEQKRPILVLETQNNDPRPFEQLQQAEYRAFNLNDYREIVDVSEIGEGRRVEDLLYVSERQDPGPFGRGGKGSVIHDVALTGPDFAFEIAVGAGINCMRIWGGAADDLLAPIMLQVWWRDRIVVNVMSAATSMFNPYRPCVLYAEKDGFAKIHVHRTAGQSTIARVEIENIALTPVESAKHRMLAVTDPFGFTW